MMPSKFNCKVLYLLILPISFYGTIVLVFPDLFVNGLIIGPSIFAYIFVLMPLSLIQYFGWEHSRGLGKTYVFISGLSLSLLILISSFFLLIFGNSFFLRRSLFWAFPVSIIISLVTILYSCNRNSEFRKWVVFFLAVLLAIVLPTSLSTGLPYLYTPPALTSESLTVYNKCIAFAKTFDEYKDMHFGMGGWSSKQSKLGYFTPLFFDTHIRTEPNLNLTNEQFENMKKSVKVISKGMSKIRCRNFQRDENMILFYKNANSLLPIAPGVLYSMNGKNPNLIDSDLLNAGKPFMNIKEDWYVSRKLVLGGPRANIPYVIPESLIDHSK